jgi:predicted nucleotidyltransferase
MEKGEQSRGIRPPVVWPDPRIVQDFPYDFDLTTHTVYAGLMGSILHGTYVPKEDPDSIDDVDIMAVVVPSPKWLLGLNQWEHWVRQRDELDVVVYSLRKFVGLLLKANPNVVGLLWLQPEFIVAKHSAFEAFIRNRHAFSSRRAYESFVGYAESQLDKMGAPGHRAYMGAKRKELVARFGYDCKNAAHSVRLLRMGIEFLETGELHVFRTSDADEIRAIKRGLWTLEQVKQEVDRLSDRIAAARERSPLPPEPDAMLAERLLIETTQQVWAQSDGG